MKTAISIVLTFLLLIPAQAVVFNHLGLFNVALPIVFIYIVVTLPVTLSTNWSTTIGFLAGLAVDIFCDTAGVNTLSCTVLAFVRKPIFHLYVSTDDDLAGRNTSARSMGHATFMKYLVTMVLIYCTMVFTIEAFQFFNFRLLVLRIISSTIYSFILLYALDCAVSRGRESA